MNDAEAYMLLALANTQSELTALERGRHALKSGLSRTAYAKVAGLPKGTVDSEVRAARVAEACLDIQTLPLDCVLTTLHSAPDWLWRVMVKRAVEEGWTVARAQKAVEAVKDAPELEPRSRYSGPEQCFPAP